MTVCATCGGEITDGKTICGDCRRERWKDQLPSDIVRGDARNRKYNTLLILADLHFQSEEEGWPYDDDE